MSEDPNEKYAVAQKLFDFHNASCRKWGNYSRYHEGKLLINAEPYDQTRFNAQADEILEVIRRLGVRATRERNNARIAAGEFSHPKPKAGEGAQAG